MLKHLLFCAAQAPQAQAQQARPSDGQGANFNLTIVFIERSTRWQPILCDSSRGPRLDDPLAILLWPIDANHPQKNQPPFGGLGVGSAVSRALFCGRLELEAIEHARRALRQDYLRHAWKLTRPVRVSRSERCTISGSNVNGTDTHGARTPRHVKTGSANSGGRP
jgi:hypothetical protein